MTRACSIAPADILAIHDLYVRVYTVILGRLLAEQLPRAISVVRRGQSTRTRGLAEYLEACERDGIDPVTATRAHVAGSCGVSIQGFGIR